MIPDIKLNEILPNPNIQIPFESLPYEDGQLPDDQARILLAILIHLAPIEVLEIGTFFGHTTLRMAAALPLSTIHTVDLPLDFKPSNPAPLVKTDFHLIMRRNTVGREFLKRPDIKNIRQHFYDTFTWDFSQAGNPTMFFIDGSHSYEYTKNDSEKCYNLCDGKGVFVWHDVDENHMGVVRFLQEWRTLGRDVRKIAGTPLGFFNGLL
jgi:hypothetical protein